MKIVSAFLALVLVTACNNGTLNDSTDSEAEKPATGISTPKIINLNIIGIYAHDTSAYTQGLEIYNGKMYESTGDFQNSSLRVTDIKSGKVIQKHTMGTKDIFGEGITIINDKIYQLTWKNNLVNVYDIKNIDNPIKTFKWPYEGWGITHRNTDLIISTGSSNLYFVASEDFKLKSTIQVTDNFGPLNGLNELEYIDGYVFANIYGSDTIVKIDPANGDVVGRIILTGLIQQYAKDYKPDQEEVLNGIAWDSAGKKLYITGKHWPKMFEALIN